MAAISAKDVQGLRQSTGVGMLDAKRALQENGGDVEAATRWLREKGLSDKAKRQDRSALQGAVAIGGDSEVAGLVLLRCETDFVAKSDEFVALCQELADLVASKGEGAVADLTAEIDRLSQTLKENISVGEVVRLAAGSGATIGTYLHRQAGRGVNAVAVILSGGDESLAHDVAVHIAFAKPAYLRREDVPEQEVASERATVEAISRNEGKPEAAMEKIVEGRMNGWFKERILLEQAYAKDEKKTVSSLLGAAEVLQFAQVLVAS